MKSLALLLVFLFLVIASTKADDYPPSPADWSAWRKLQPEGLDFKMTLPKDHFYQGEIIEATLYWRNNSKEPFHIWAGKYDRSGRITDLGFLAKDSIGNFMPDPAAWYFMKGGERGGAGQVDSLGTWSFTLPVNQWLRFDKPGTYTIYAWSSRVHKGDIDITHPMQTEKVDLVSDPITLTIEPLQLDVEKAVIEDAKARIARGGEDEAKASLAKLLYLQTPAARAQLVLYLGQPDLEGQAAEGLVAAPNPPVEAEDVLRAVREQKIPLSDFTIYFYSLLKTCDPKWQTVVAPQGLFSEERQEQQSLIRQEQEEIIQVGLKASGGKGPSYLRALVGQLRFEPKAPGPRAALAKVQLQLSKEQVNDFLYNWNSWGGEEFTPLARKMAGGPEYSLLGLRALLKTNLAEGIALLAEDARQPRSRYFAPNRNIYEMADLQLAATPQPELDSVLLEHFKTGSDPEVAAFYIYQFASPALLPEVITQYRTQEKTWDPERQRFYLRYWLRCDPEAGVEALAQALTYRSGGGYRNLLQRVLNECWVPAALPLVMKALQDPDFDVVNGAVRVLELHADSASIAPVIAALDRVQKETDRKGVQPGKGRGTYLAMDLLASKNWTYTTEQKRHLEAMGDGPHLP